MLNSQQTCKLNYKSQRRVRFLKFWAKFMKFQLKKHVFDFTDYDLEFVRKKEMNFRFRIRILTGLVVAKKPSKVPINLKIMKESSLF